MNFKEFVLTFFVYFPLLTVNAPAQTILAGNVSGTWDVAGSPYHLIDDCTVPNGNQLIIEPGVEVVIGEGMALLIYGKISAIGTSNQPITFRAVNNNVKFNLIYLQNGSSNPPISEFKYCTFRNAQTGLYLHTVGRIANAYTTMKTNVYNCDFDSTVSTALYVRAQARDASQYMTPRRLHARANPFINGCTFDGNTMGIIVHATGYRGAYYSNGNTAAIFQNNLFLNLRGPAIKMLPGDLNGGTPAIINNTILNCKRGVWIQDGNYDVTTINNIFCKTDSAMERTGGTSSTTFYNCFYENEVDFIGYPPTYGDIVITNQNGDSCDIGFNIFLDPLFANTNDYILSPDSPCIDAGHSNEVYNDIGDPNNPGFAFFPSQGTLRNDIGAYGGQGAAIWETGPILNVQPTELTFPEKSKIESSSSNIQISNRGTEILNIFSIELSGQDTSNFQLDASTFTLQVDSSKDVPVIFNPNRLGVYLAYIDIASNGGNISIPLSGNVTFPIIEIEPQTISFQSTIVGDTTTETISIKNIGNKDLYPSLIHIVGPDSTQFVYSAFSQAIAPDSVKELAILFIPETSGEFNATLVIASDGGTGQVTLKGEAIDPADAMKPRIKTIVDIPNDQGKQVLLCWNASSFDTKSDLNPDTLIQEYMCWRKLDFDALAVNLTNNDIKFIPVSNLSEMVDKATEVKLGVNFIVNINGPSNEEIWTAVGGLLATQSEVYSLVSPTLFDSTKTEGMHWSTFFVSAHTANPKVWFASPPDSGYSIDNLAPEVPQGLMAEAGLNDVALTWTENQETDLNYYKVYRGDLGDFTEMTELATTDETLFHDTEYDDSKDYFYRVTAIDFSGNESQPSNAASLDITGVELTNLKPTEFNLEQNYPNPFNPITEIHYSIPEDAQTSLIVYDIQGRTIAELVHQVQPAGNYSVRFDGSKLATGLYFYRLETSSFLSIKKMMLIK